MKKKLAVILAGTCMVSILLAGCSSNEASNDYVSIEGYKGIEVAKVDDASEVTDDQVDNAVQSTLQQNAESKEVTDRAVESGDIANINFVGKVDGAEFDGGSAEAYDLEIGSGAFIDGFEDSIVGHNTGDVFDFEGSFPEDYNNTDLAGKPVTFTITLNSISKKEVPELNDDFVKKVSEKSKTVKEYKKEVKKQLEKEAKESYDNNLENEVWSAVLEKAEVKKNPKKDVKRFTEQLIQQYKDAAEYYELSYEEFLQNQMGTTVEDFEKQVDQAAKDNAKQQQVAKVIAKKENLEPSDKEYKKEFQKLADEYGYEDIDALKEAASEDDLKMIVLQDKVKAWLTEHCVQVVQDDKDSKDSDK